MGLSASQIYAVSQSNTVRGEEESCHWCGSPCPRKWPHDDPEKLWLNWIPASRDPKNPLYRKPSTAKRPSNAYVCPGCYLYRRQRLTVNFLGGGQKDGQAPKHHSWWVDLTGAWALGKDSAEDACLRLMSPPHQFVLMLRTGECDENHIHLAEANDHDEIKADTPLVYTVNNQRMDYTVYELEEAMKHGVEGKSPGVRALFDFFNIYTLATNRPDDEELQAAVRKAESKRGRPRKLPPLENDVLGRMVTQRSG